jgi:anti-sigma factor RsiW
MAKPDLLKEHQIQDYIDGRLDERDRAHVTAYLLARPELASDVEALRRQNEALRGLGREILDEPVPARLGDVLQRQTVVDLGSERRRRVSPFVEAAAAVFLFCLGGVLGWFVHERLTPQVGVENLIAASAADVYAFYNSERDYPLDFPPDRTEDLVSWISRSFERDIGPPDLAGLSYAYRGGRVLPISGASSGFFEFESPDGDRLAVFFWPAERAPTRLDEMGRQGNIAARYWLGDGFSFAVMGDRANPDLEDAAETVFSFYDEAFAP